MTKPQLPIALSIAGSDSGGGAGIQADLKTFQAFGVFGTTALTAVTAQNTEGVQAIHPIPLNIVRAQIDSVVGDLRPTGVKSGMLATAADIEVRLDSSDGSSGLVTYDADSNRLFQVSSDGKAALGAPPGTSALTVGPGPPGLGLPVDPRLDLEAGIIGNVLGIGSGAGQFSRKGFNTAADGHHCGFGADGLGF